MRYQQYERLRSSLNQRAVEERDYYNRNDYRNERSNYHMRIAQDPRMPNRDVRRIKYDNDDSDSSDARHNQKAYKR